MSATKQQQTMPDYEACSIKKIFAEVPATYEFVNHVLTLGFDVLWRRRMAGTIPRFYTAEELADIMREAGFDRVTFRRPLFGVVAIHQAFKY